MNDLEVNKSFDNWFKNSAPYLSYIGFLLSSLGIVLWNFIKNKFKAQARKIRKIEDKYEEEKEKREIAEKEREEKHTAHCEACKSTILTSFEKSTGELIERFQDGMRVDKDFRDNILAENKSAIKEVKDHLDTITSTVVALKTAQELYVKIGENKALEVLTKLIETKLMETKPTEAQG